MTITIPIVAMLLLARNVVSRGIKLNKLQKRMDEAISAMHMSAQTRATASGVK